MHDLWREIALSSDEQARDTSFQHGQNKLAVQSPIKIASLPLKQYKPEDISLDVDGENIILHGQHRSEREDGFENNEFKKIIKLPDGVDPTTVKSRVIKTLNKGNVLVLEGDRRVEEKAKQDDGKFVVKLDLRGFKPEDIKIQLRGHELAVTGKHKSEDQGFYFSRDYSNRVLLPDDADLGSVTSRLSKEGLLIIEASRDPALLPKERNVEVSMELGEQEPEEQAKPVARYRRTEQKLNELWWLIVRHYLLFSKTCLTSVIFFVKILKARNIEQHFSMRSISFFWSNLTPLRG